MVNVSFKQGEKETETLQMMTTFSGGTMRVLRNTLEQQDINRSLEDPLEELETLDGYPVVKKNYFSSLTPLRYHQHLRESFSSIAKNDEKGHLNHTHFEMLVLVEANSKNKPQWNCNDLWCMTCWIMNSVPCCTFFRSVMIAQCRWRTHICYWYNGQYFSMPQQESLNKTTEVLRKMNNEVQNASALQCT